MFPGKVFETYDMIAQGTQVIQAICAAGLIWRAEVCREETKDIRESDLILHHLIIPLRACQCGQVCMTPRVTPNLMALIVHALDERRVPSLRIVDLPFAAVVADEEESSLDSLLFEDVEHSRGVDVRAVIEGECNLARDAAVPDTDTVWSAA
jgi:hypothetical protein